MYHLICSGVLGPGTYGLSRGMYGLSRGMLYLRESQNCACRTAATAAPTCTSRDLR